METHDSYICVAEAFWLQDLANTINPESGEVVAPQRSVTHLHRPHLVLCHVPVTLTFMIHLWLF